MDAIYGGNTGRPAMRLEQKHEESNDLEVVTELPFS